MQIDFLNFIFLCFTDFFFFFFYKLVCGNPMSSKSMVTIFLTAFDYFNSLSYILFFFFHNISNFFFIIIFIM